MSSGWARDAEKFERSRRKMLVSAGGNGLIYPRARECRLTLLCLAWYGMVWRGGRARHCTARHGIARLE